MKKLTQDLVGPIILCVAALCFPLDPTGTKIMGITLILLVATIYMNAAKMIRDHWNADRILQGTACLMVGGSFVIIFL